MQSLWGEVKRVEWDGTAGEETLSHCQIISTLPDGSFNGTIDVSNAHTHVRTYARTYVHIHLEYYSWINLQMKGNNCVIVHAILQKWVKKRGEGGRGGLNLTGKVKEEGESVIKGRREGELKGSGTIRDR